MNTTLDDGGPAFPHANPNYDGNWDKRGQIDGMSLRDWFAGMALQGVMVNAQGLGEMDPEKRARLLKQVACLLYETSDAMLAARKEKP